jgi:hypothetical protein
MLGQVPSGMDDGLVGLRVSEMTVELAARLTTCLDTGYSRAHGDDACRLTRLEGHGRMAPMKEAMRAIRRPVL